MKTTEIDPAYGALMSVDSLSACHYHEPPQDLSFPQYMLFFFSYFSGE